MSNFSEEKIERAGDGKFAPKSTSETDIALDTPRLRLKESQQAFKGALDSIAESGTTVKMNVMECCRGCVGPDKIGLTDESAKTEPYVWHFGGQDQELVWRNGEPFRQDADEERCECTEDEYEEDQHGNEVLAYEGEECYWCSNRYDGPEVHRTNQITLQHGNGGADVAKQAFEDAGFKVDWNGSNHQTVTVHFPQD